ncbi:hypothetical protein AB0D11_05230 [Streptomyces monashensis]|uniref:hypothetical protein n=1 Tax=Streptomyces monashensis TaxID=1678012 RepID=UPI0033C510F8
MSIKMTRRTRFTRSTAMLVSALTAGAIFATSTGAHAAEAAHRTTAPAALAAEETSDDAQWEALLDTMMSIPEDVLEQGDAATIAYLKQREQNGELPQGQVQPRFGWPSFGCLGAVAVAVGSNLLPAAKMVKIVKIAKRVGVKRVVSAIKAIRKGKGHTLANDLQWAGAQLLGLEGVKAACS